MRDSERAPAEIHAQTVKRGIRSLSQQFGSPFAGLSIMNAAVSTFTEHRDDIRVTGHASARMEALKGIFTQSGPAVIEEVSACGLRLRSESQLHQDEDLVVHLKGEPLPIHANVIWVREAPPIHLGGHKTWIAGCRLHPGSYAKVRLEPEVKAYPFKGMGRKVLLVAGIAGLAAVLVYLYLRFATIIGGSWFK
jgi:hypothetical protein